MTIGGKDSGEEREGGKGKERQGKLDSGIWEIEARGKTKTIILKKVYIRIL